MIRRVTLVALAAAMALCTLGAVAADPQRVAIPKNSTWMELAWGAPNGEEGKPDLRGEFMVDVDIDTQRHLIKPLREAGHIVMCYFSVGTMEYFRPDVKHNEEEWKKACVHQMSDWHECWLDITKLDLLKKLQGPRFHKAKAEGCHGVEPDNIDCYANGPCRDYLKGGMSEHEAEPYQLEYNKWQTEMAHSLGLSIAMKNAVGLIEHQHKWYDMAINEQCQFYDECSEYKHFTDANKLVAQVEYNDDGHKYCEGAKKYDMKTLYCSGSDSNGICDKHSSWHQCFKPHSPLPDIQYD